MDIKLPSRHINIVRESLGAFGFLHIIEVDFSDKCFFDLKKQYNDCVWIVLNESNFRFSFLRDIQPLIDAFAQKSDVHHWCPPKYMVNLRKQPFHKAYRWRGVTDPDNEFNTAITMWKPWLSHLPITKNDDALSARMSGVLWEDISFYMATDEHMGFIYEDRDLNIAGKTLRSDAAIVGYDVDHISHTTSQHIPCDVLVKYDDDIHDKYVRISEISKKLSTLTGEYDGK